MNVRFRMLLLKVLSAGQAVMGMSVNTASTERSRPEFTLKRSPLAAKSLYSESENQRYVF